jgi:SnoaL-like polyketide cyclase
LNKRIMHRFTEFINTASEKLAAELISPKAVFQVPGRLEPLQGPAGYLEIIGMMRGGFPDIRSGRLKRRVRRAGGFVQTP